MQQLSLWCTHRQPLGWRSWWSAIGSGSWSESGYAPTRRSDRTGRPAPGYLAGSNRSTSGTARPSANSDNARCHDRPCDQSPAERSGWCSNRSPVGSDCSGRRTACMDPAAKARDRTRGHRRESCAPSGALPRQEAPCRSVHHATRRARRQPSQSFQPPHEAPAHGGFAGWRCGAPVRQMSECPLRPPGTLAPVAASPNVTAGWMQRRRCRDWRRGNRRKLDAAVSHSCPAPVRAAPAGGRVAVVINTKTAAAGAATVSGLSVRSAIARWSAVPARGAAAIGQYSAGTALDGAGRRKPLRAASPQVHPRPLVRLTERAGRHLHDRDRYGQRLRGKRFGKRLVDPVTSADGLGGGGLEHLDRSPQASIARGPDPPSRL